jgi:hypothetical protein
MEFYTEIGVRVRNVIPEEVILEGVVMFREKACEVRIKRKGRNRMGLRMGGQCANGKQDRIDRRDIISISPVNIDFFWANAHIKGPNCSYNNTRNFPRQGGISLKTWKYFPGIHT